MPIERACAHVFPKPWGVADLRPWSKASGKDGAIGEIWYERPGSAAPDPSLLLKVLFASQPLSIQVHPDDTFAHSIGMPNGKTEAWYVLSAASQAKVALGLDQRLTSRQLRSTIEDGSISNHVVWQSVSAGDVIFVPAGTIHAIGAGLVIAELQQRSDVTFRIFDHGRQRILHVENAIAVANTGPAEFQVHQDRLTPERTILVSCPYFVFEKLNLPPNSSWSLEAERETWLLVLSGRAVAGSFDVGTGDAIFAQSDSVDIQAGTSGMVCLAAYPGGGPLPHLIATSTKPRSSVSILSSGSRGLYDLKVRTPLSLAKTAPKSGRMETNK